MDTTRYHQLIQVRQAELAALGPANRRRLAERARARSARRWADAESRPDQERRAGRLGVITGGRTDAA